MLILVVCLVNKFEKKKSNMCPQNDNFKVIQLKMPHKKFYHKFTTSLDYYKHNKRFMLFEIDVYLFEIDVVFVCCFSFLHWT